jgi:hypothetical protein
MMCPPKMLLTGLMRVGIASVAALGLMVAIPGSAQAAGQPSVGLGTAKTYAVLAGTEVANTGATTISGDVGLNPGKQAAITGFPPALLANGTRQAGDAAALQAQADLTKAYLDAQGRTPVVVVSKDLGGQTLAPGVYKATTALELTGTVTLDAHNDPNSVFIFQAGSDLVTSSTSQVRLVNGASSCNVFWQVTSSATLGSDSHFRGSILALTSISLNSRATVDGRVLARNGAVTLKANQINSPHCAAGVAAATPAAQVTAVPKGGVRTGDGSTSGTGNNAQTLLAGEVMLAGVGVATLVASRRRRRLKA